LEEERFDKAVERFRKDIGPMLQDTEDIYFEIRKLADDYGGYDFSEYAEECIKNYLGV
jgi:hypothetical protein